MSITDLDFMILDAIQKIRNSFLDSFFATITHLGDSGILAILIAILSDFRHEEEIPADGYQPGVCAGDCFCTGKSDPEECDCASPSLLGSGEYRADCGAEGLLVPFRTHACVGSAGCGAVA